MKFIYWLESVVDWFTDMAFDNPEVTPFTDPEPDAYPVEEYSLYGPVDESEIGNEFNYTRMMLGGNARQRAQASMAFHTQDDD